MTFTNLFVASRIELDPGRSSLEQIARTGRPWCGGENSLQAAPRESPRTATAATRATAAPPKGSSFGAFELSAVPAAKLRARLVRGLQEIQQRRARRRRSAYVLVLDQKLIEIGAVEGP